MPESQRCITATERCNTFIDILAGFFFLAVGSYCLKVASALEGDAKRVLTNLLGVYAILAAIYLWVRVCADNTQRVDQSLLNEATPSLRRVL
ncbi:MAG: hypothetical protein A3F17_09385 [Gammaproteobacteria bacterium RIFCSPHIGHO2_12_FULL_41_15]|nr:MAG: hypothetical protein A3F17_09385 [Gammaproteobacteria bacterium RIFCSPHIGHO2_12_FULL_41_15]